MLYTKKNNVNSIISFLPGIIFLATYIVLYYYTINTIKMYHSSTTILAGLPLSAACIATFCAYFSFQQPCNIHKKLKIFLSGIAHFSASTACFEIIVISSFNYILAITNAVLTTVTISLLYIPTQYMLLALFIIPACIAMIIPSLPISILLYLPIAHGIAQSLAINTACVVATVISGALCGTHLIMSLRTNNKSAIVLSHASWFILATAVTTLLILSQYEIKTFNSIIYHHLAKNLHSSDYLTLLPYLCLLIANLYKIHLLASLIMSFCMALAVKIFYYKILFLDTFTTTFQGFYQSEIAVNVFLFHIIMAGLINIMIYNGGFAYILKKLETKNKKSMTMQYISFLSMIMITNFLAIIPELALQLLANPLHTITIQYHTPKDSIKKLVYIITTIIQMLLPYSTIVLLGMHITHITYFEILQYMFYPYIISFLLIITTYSASIKTKKSIE